MRCGRKIGGGVGSSVARAPFANRWILSERQKFSLNFLGFVRQEFAKAPRPGHLRWLGMVSRVSKRKRLEFLDRSEEHTSELQSRLHLVCRLLLEKKKITKIDTR